MCKSKNTSIKLLFSDEGSGNSWWTCRDYSENVDAALELALILFGKPGTQKGRRWFYRIRQEIYYTRLERDLRLGTVSFVSVPQFRHWCWIYFRDPGDAVWFKLQQDNIVQL